MHNKQSNIIQIAHENSTALGGWVGGWMNGRAELRIAYSNKKLNCFLFEISDEFRLSVTGVWLNCFKRIAQ